MRRSLALVLGLVLASAIVSARLHYAVWQEDIPNPYASTHLAIALSSGVVGVWFAWRRPDQAIGWVILSAGLIGGWMYASQPFLVELYIADAPDWVLERVPWLIVWPWFVARSLLLIVAPSLVIGETLRRARRTVMWAGLAVTAVWCVGQFIMAYDQPMGFTDDSSTAFRRFAAEMAKWAQRGQWIAGLLATGSLLVAGLMLNGSAVRRQTRWFVLGAAALSFVGVGELGREIVPDWYWPGDTWEQITSALLPVSLAMAALFDHLLDVRVVVRRFVVYIALAALGTAVYLAALTLGSEAFSASDRIARALSTVALALALIPAHASVQRWAQRHIYGQSNRPDLVLRDVGVRLSQASGAREALTAMVSEVAQTMLLPYVAVELGAPQTARTLTIDAGARTTEVEEFPLAFAGADLGRLLVGRRSPSEPLRDRERELLAQLAGQAGVVARDVFLETQLRLSREEIVVAREEERRRLRGDLHDGLGPTLASVALGLDAAAQRLPPSELATLLTELNGDVRQAIDDIRRLVYGLRPPSLDEMGLARAIEHYARALGSRAAGALDVRVDLGQLPDLPAAVEVAAYRIATEALTNVTRHADAKRCDVVLDIRQGDLWVEVADDGQGMSSSAVDGVGLASMRERAEELRGGLRIESSRPGTRVLAWLPLAAVPA
ncbi:MAG: sensor histidine kinase [Actinobacteria bacterium]|nr:sensor histidine kinase [Actinomycetota bacterium]